MPVNELTRIKSKIALIHSYLIGSHTITLTTKGDFSSVRNGLFLWISILLDHNLMLGLNDQVHAVGSGRLRKIVDELGAPKADLTPTLRYLDECDSALISELSTSHPFKGDAFIKRVRTDPPHGGLVNLFCSSVDQLRAGNLRMSDFCRLCHQSLSFLKKIEVNRPDLEDNAIAEFFRFEAELGAREPLVSDADKRQLLTEMNLLAREHLRDFDVTQFHPKHGPGAVADPTTKSWYEKNLTMALAGPCRLLLAVNSLGEYGDYVPFGTIRKSNRMSRFISVPKTWKKLRGISAEPVELQFFQQGVLHAIDDLFTKDSWWRARVDLHDQHKSRELARIGSASDSYATIDLSAASDSVTLELVKHVFEGTPLLPWLLGTRSTHTSCNDKHVKLAKFAPMGSACCFPVECIIFTLAAQVASDRTRTFLDNNPTIRVYGDDIIIDWYAADECVSVLNQLGFSVNTDKSFLSGFFKEACGVEAYRGEEIQSLRYSRIDQDLDASSFTMENAATALSYVNSLYERGLHGTRRYLLGSLLRKKVVMGKRSYPLQRFIHSTFDGSRGTLASPCPTNFNLKFRWNKDTQCREAPIVAYRLRPTSSISGSAMAELFSGMKYHEWQLRHQPSCTNVDVEEDWDYPFLQRASEVDQRVPIGFRMIPRESWVPWLHGNNSLA